MDGAIVARLLLEESINGPQATLLMGPMKLIHQMRERAVSMGCPLPKVDFSFTHMDPPARQFPIHAFTDGDGTVRHVHNLAGIKLCNKRRITDVANIREYLAAGEVSTFGHISGITNPADGLTKHYGPQHPVRLILDQMLFDGVIPPEVWLNRKIYVTQICTTGEQEFHNQIGPSSPRDSDSDS